MRGDFLEQVKLYYSGKNEKKKKGNAQARNRTGGPTMATLDFTTKPLALTDYILMVEDI